MINSLDFLLSENCRKGKFIYNNEFLTWVKLRNKETSVSINKIELKSITNWSFNEKLIKHSSNKFFKINGINVEKDYLSVKKSWNQPIINQNEIGILGFIVKKIDGILHFLVQAKVEPGNVNFVQISPTLQATKSN